jgi:hypothetical protein
MSTPNWTTPPQLAAQLQRRWDDGSLLAARLSGVSLFPMQWPLRQPSAAQLGEQFDQVRTWIRQLEAAAKPAQPHGYVIGWRDINHRQLGRNRLPATVAIEREDDALRQLGRQAEAARFDRLAAATLAMFPALSPWLQRHPLVLLEQASAWPQVLATLQWFQAHPRPQRYLRQLDIHGVDSKFIETRRGLLGELLDQILPAESIEQQAVGARNFERRYGLLSKPVQIRFRILDPAHYLCGLSDLAVPVAQFSQLQPGVRQVFITENEINGLAWPATAASMVIFGGGYGIDRLAEVAWLKEKDIIYWGDIDTHGFAILDRLRALFPHTRSILMDVGTLERHKPLWGREDDAKRFSGQLQRLTAHEREVYEGVRDDVFGQHIRLEQERLSFVWVEQAIRDAQKPLAIPAWPLL